VADDVTWPDWEKAWRARRIAELGPKPAEPDPPSFWNREEYQDWSRRRGAWAPGAAWERQVAEGAHDAWLRHTGRLVSYGGAPAPRSIPNGVEILGPSTMPESWRPVDLGPILAGTHVRPEPDIGLARADGLRLLYPGKEHTVIGEHESGKSWVAAASVAAELTKGQYVLYVHFEESDPSDTVDRLRDLGVPDEVIRARFRFVGPSEPVTPEALAALLVPVPSLVVLDGVNEAMSLHRFGILDVDGAAAYRRVLVKPCTATGAVVLSADHVVKDRDKRFRDPLGSIHKGNGLTGSLILLENVEPFGRGQKGASHVFVTKDRPGYLRRHGRPGKLPGKTYMGTLTLDDTRQHHQYPDLTFLAPREPDAATVEPVTQAEADDAAVLAAVNKLKEAGRQATMRAVEANAGISKGRTGGATERLVLRGALTEASGPRNARIFDVPDVTVPATVPEDHLSTDPDGDS
jgi:hypothetical protein